MSDRIQWWKTVHKLDALCPHCYQPWSKHEKRYEVGFECDRALPVHEGPKLRSGKVHYCADMAARKREQWDAACGAGKDSMLANYYAAVTCKKCLKVTPVTK